MSLSWNSFQSNWEDEMPTRYTGQKNARRQKQIYFIRNQFQFLLLSQWVWEASWGNTGQWSRFWSWKNVYSGFLLSLMWWSGSTNLQPRCCRNPVCMFPFPGVNPCDSWGFMSYHPLHNHSFYHHHQPSQLLVYNPDLSFTKKTVLDMVKSWDSRVRLPRFSSAFPPTPSVFSG